MIEDFALFIDWSRKLAPISQPIRYKNETSYNLTTCDSYSLLAYNPNSLWLLKSSFRQYDYVARHHEHITTRST